MLILVHLQVFFSQKLHLFFVLFVIVCGFMLGLFVLFGNVHAFFDRLRFYFWNIRAFWQLGNVCAFRGNMNSSWGFFFLGGFLHFFSEKNICIFCCCCVSKLCVYFEMFMGSLCFFFRNCSIYSGCCKS